MFPKSYYRSQWKLWWFTYRTSLFGDFTSARRYFYLNATFETRNGVLKTAGLVRVRTVVKARVGGVRRCAPTELLGFRKFKRYRVGLYSYARTYCGSNNNVRAETHLSERRRAAFLNELFNGIKVCGRLLYVEQKRAWLTEKQYFFFNLDGLSTRGKGLKFIPTTVNKTVIMSSHLRRRP